MNEPRDLGVTLVGATMLMLSMVYLTQCSSRTPTPAPASQSSTATASVPPGASVKDQRGGTEKEDDEESARVKSIGHAIQTIGANPELRKTYGFDQ